MMDIRAILQEAAERNQQISLELDTTEIVAGIAEEYTEVFQGVLMDRVKIRLADGGAIYIALSDVARVIRFN